MWDVIVLIPDHCLSIYFVQMMSMPFGPFTQVSDSGPHSPLLLCLPKYSFVFFFCLEYTCAFIKLNGIGASDCI